MSLWCIGLQFDCLFHGFLGRPQAEVTCPLEMNASIPAGSKKLLATLLLRATSYKGARLQDWKGNKGANWQDWKDSTMQTFKLKGLKALGVASLKRYSSQPDGP